MSAPTPEPVFSRGIVDTIHVEIPAVTFGSWAAHPSVSYSESDARAVDDGAYDLGDPARHGWVVTHIPTGRTLPADLVDGLTQGEAETIAAALEDCGEEALLYSFDVWDTAPMLTGHTDADAAFAAWDASMRIIVDTVYRTLAELDEAAVRAAAGGTQ